MASNKGKYYLSPFFLDTLPPSSYTPPEKTVGHGKIIMPLNEPPTCEIQQCVPFYDLDPIQIVWHGNYFNYFENARVALFAQLGVNLFDYYKRTQCLFPIIRTATKHIYPLRYGDEFLCKAILREGKSKIVVDFEIRLQDSGKLCTRGRTEQIAVQAPEMEILFTIPDEIRKSLGF